MYRALALPVLAFALSLPPTPTATAATSTLVVRGSLSFSLKASNGYAVIVERLGHSVSLVAYRAHRFLASAGYTVRSHGWPDRIDARFGKFGRVAVKFEMHRIKHGPPLSKGCSGHPETIRFGVFIGTIKFRGERGYTSLDAHEAFGRVSSGSRQRCDSPLRRNARPDGARSTRLLPPELTAAEGFARGLSTWVVPRSGSIVVDAATRERRGRINIFRRVEVEGKPDTFTFAEDLSTAMLHPPWPFLGEAIFQRTSNGRTWLGSLSASFPGRDDVRLAGPQFSARLTRETE